MSWSSPTGKWLVRVGAFLTACMVLWGIWRCIHWMRVLYQLSPDAFLERSLDLVVPAVPLALIAVGLTLDFLAYTKKGDP